MKYWWCFHCYDSTLNYGSFSSLNKEYGSRKESGQYVRMGDTVGVIMDTIKGHLSFVVNGVNLGVAFKRIPLDKPLVPCVLLRYEGDSVELDPSGANENAGRSILIPSNVTAKNGITWDSLILEWSPVEGASFYQVEFDGRIFNDLNNAMKFVKRGLLPDTEYSFRVRAVVDNSVSKWSGTVKRKTLKKTFETSGWKKFRGWNKSDNKPFVNENNLRTVPTCCDIIIGNTSLPPNKVNSWNIKLASSRHRSRSEYNFYAGVAPSDIDQNDSNSYYDHGWYINNYDLTLISGPPHEYKNKQHGQNKGKHIQSGDSVGVVMDTIKGELSFVVNGMNLGVAYEGIPLDKPLVPCVIPNSSGDFVGIIIDNYSIQIINLNNYKQNN